MSMGKHFIKVHANFYPGTLLGLARALYQTLCWVNVIFLSQNSQKKRNFRGKKIRIFIILENMSIEKPFKKVHVNFYRGMPSDLACALYQTFCWVTIIFQSEFAKNGNFRRKKFKFLKFSKLFP